MPAKLKCIAGAASAVFNTGVTAPRYFPSVADLTQNGSAQAMLHERASAATRAQFGNSVFVRAVVEVSNFCRENCAYCGMRRDNRALVRYRAQHERIAELLIHQRPTSVTDVNIQAGEDPVAVREVVLPLIRNLRQHTNLGISVCLGCLPETTYAELRAAGATIYIMKFEAGDPAMYERFQAPGTLPERLRHIRHLASAGWMVSSGFIGGLPGQTASELVGNFRVAAELPLSGCSVSPFVPGNETPLGAEPGSDINWTLNSMAALRLMRPEWVIPAVSALNLAVEEGYRRGLRAGANLATINLTPVDLRADYVIYKRDRFIMTEDRVLGAIDAEGLRPSPRSLADYYRAHATATVVTTSA